MTTLKVDHMGGITSCLSVGLHELAKYRGTHGHWPLRLDMSGSFYQYRDRPGQDIAAMLLAPSIPIVTAPPIVFDHGHQYAEYADLTLAELRAVAMRYLRPSGRVGGIAYEITKRIAGRTCVLYRGNDKSKEIARTPYQRMFDMAHDCGSASFAVQTDELEFFEQFKALFPDTIAVSDLPMIRRDDSKVIVGGSAFAAKFLAVIWAMSQSRYLLTNTGNTALWCAIYRGNALGLWQYHPILQRFKRPSL